MTTQVFATRGYEHIADRLVMAQNQSMEQRYVHFEQFPDGEFSIKTEEFAPGDSALVVGGTDNDGATLELYDLCFGLLDQRVYALTIVIPYFGNARQDKRGNTGRTVIKAKARTHLLSGLPKPPGGIDVILLDPHVTNLDLWFTGVRTRSVSLYDFWSTTIPDIAKLAKVEKFAIGSVDFGRPKLQEMLATKCHAPQLFLAKERISGSEIQITKLFGTFDDDIGALLIVDDILSTGGSAIQASARYHSALADRGGAIPEIYLLATHGVLCNDALATIQAANRKGKAFIKAVFISDSHPNSVANAERYDSFCRVYSCAPTLAQVL